MNERRIVAAAAVWTGLSIPLFLLVFALWGAHGLSQADAMDPAKVAPFAVRAPVLYAILPIVGVLMHLAALLVVVGMHRRLAARAPLLMGAASALGLVWIGADTLQNLMHYGGYLGGGSPEHVAAVAAAADAVWHAGHLPGGLWVLGLAASADFLSRPLRVLSVVAGAVFTLHALVFPLWPAYFGLEFLLVPVWCIWTGIALARSPANEAVSVDQAVDADPSTAAFASSPK